MADKKEEKKPDLTEEQKKAYLEKSYKCPFCHSPDIEGQSLEVDSGHAWQPVSCVSCGRRWNDLYDLVGVEARDID